MTTSDGLRFAIPTGHESSVFIVSVSGGKDSAALACEMKRLAQATGIAVRYVFADTGWEAPETYEYLGTIERVLGIAIDRVQSEHGGMLDIATHKAAFPFRKGRWCTEELKAKPIRAYHERVAVECDTDTVAVVGIRAEESSARAEMSSFEFDVKWKGYVWRPMMAWTVRDVLDAHHRAGLPVNPLYKLGHGRVGCYPCINETKDGVRLIAQHRPERIDLIDKKEREFTAERARRNVSGEGDFNHPQATFFQSRGAVGAAGEFPPTPIREVVAWSRTSRGGVQLNLLQESPDSGCFRWGFCEAPEKGEGDAE